MNFESLVGHINQVQDVLQAQAAHAINQSLTVTEGLSQNLFVSKYRLQLPSEDDIKQYLLENISEEKFKELKEEEEKAE